MQRVHLQTPAQPNVPPQPRGRPATKRRCHRPGRPALARLTAIPCLSVLLLGAPARGAQFWVSPTGCDTNPATAQKPLATISAALRKARELRRLSGGGIDAPVEIVLRDGLYSPAAPLRFGAEDSGTADSPTILTAAPGEHPLLSGGLAIEGWRRLRRPPPGLAGGARGHLWVAEAPRRAGRVVEFAQLWVNGTKAVLARRPNRGQFFRLSGWDKINRCAWVPTAALVGIDRPGRLEMIVDQVWEIAMLRVKTLRTQAGRGRLSFESPESEIEFQHPWPPVLVGTNYSAPFFLANAIEFLDQPGEWFEDLSAGKVYYWPRPGEDMARAKVWAPGLPTLVDLSGTLDAPVSNVVFRGITFAYTAWSRPWRAGLVPLQAGMPLLEAYRLSPKGTADRPKLDNAAWIDRPPGAVSIKNANHIVLERCRFEHTASAGLDIQSGTHDDRVQGCLFSDIGGNGIQLGKFSDPGIETHVAYNPADSREVCLREVISDNVLRDCGAEDWGCVGICVGYARNIAIKHNDVSHLPYTGISVGWGWTRADNCMSNNFIFANRIHEVGRRLGDFGGIYTLSAQPGTLVAQNCVFGIEPSRFVPDPQHWYYLYADEGSSFITFRDNWCPAEKFLRNANGPGNVWTNNGPTVSEKIKDAAGLEPAFRDLLNQ